MNQVYKKAYTEILEIIKYLPHDEYEKIPKEKVEFYKNYRDPLYQFKYNPYKSLNEQNVLRETKAIIVDLFREVIATKEQKEKLNILLIQNEQEYQSKVHEKYSYDNLFKHKKNETLEVTNEQESIPKETSLVEYKESLFVKIINKIKNIFHFGKKI